MRRIRWKPWRCGCCAAARRTASPACPPLRETPTLRLLRPLLGDEPPAAAELSDSRGGIGWIEDPSNQDPAGAALPGCGRRSAIAPRTSGATRRAYDIRRHATAARGRRRPPLNWPNARPIRPEGFALLSPGRISAAALRCLLRTIGGARYHPSPAQITELAAQPRPATVAGVRILPAGRLGDGLLIVREEAAIGPPAPALARGDLGRPLPPDRLQSPGLAAPSIGKLGNDAARFQGVLGPAIRGFADPAGDEGWRSSGFGATFRLCSSR